METHYKDIKGSDPQRKDKTDKYIEEDENIFQKMTTLIRLYIFRSNDPKYEKIRMMRNIRNDLKELKVKIFDFRKNQVTTKFPKLLFEIYKYIYPLKDIVRVPSSDDKSVTKSLEDFFVEASLNETQKNLLEEFSEDKIKEHIETKGIKEANSIINETFKKFQKSFVKDDISKINYSLNELEQITGLVQYDLYPLIKKFAPGFQEEKYLEPPRFISIEGHDIVEHLKDLCDLLYSINLKEGKFDDSLKTLSEYRGKDIISKDELGKFINLLRYLVANNYVLLLTKYLTHDPFYSPVVLYDKAKNIVQNYFRNLSYQIKERRDTILRNLRDNRLNSMLKELFGTSDINTLKYYVEPMNEKFKDLNTSTYRYPRALNYLKYFMMEKYNHYIRETINKLLIEGEYVTPSISKETSDNYFVLNEVMKRLLEIDDSLADEQQRGHRMHSLIMTINREPSNRKVLDEYIQTINYEAELVLVDAFTAFNVIQRFASRCISDTEKGTKQILNNLRSIDGTSNKMFLEELQQSIKEIKKLITIIGYLVPHDVLGIKDD